LKLSSIRVSLTPFAVDSFLYLTASLGHIIRSAMYRPNFSISSPVHPGAFGSAYRFVCYYKNIYYIFSLYN
jgi:hypothetical protein